MPDLKDPHIRLLLDLFAGLSLTIYRHISDEEMAAHVSYRRAYAMLVERERYQPTEDNKQNDNDS
jgi:predicted lactoylglutathione lyase